MGDVKVTGLFAKERLKDLASAGLGSIDSLRTKAVNARTIVADLGGHVGSTEQTVDTAAALDAAPGAVNLSHMVSVGEPHYKASPGTGTDATRVVGQVGNPTSRNGATGLGGLLIVRPTMQDIEMGALPSDIILVSAGSVSSPFASARPVTYGLGGSNIPGAGVSNEAIDAADATPLYGDLSFSGFVNRVVDGGSQLAKKVVSADFWHNLSPQTKAALGTVGAGVGLWAANKVVNPLTWMRMGSKFGGPGDGSQDANPAVDTYIATPAVNATSGLLVNGSRAVDGEMDVAQMGKRWFPVSNNFFAGAYALGKEYEDRSTHPSFGVLSADPRIAAKALRGLRAPKFWVQEGRILRTSAPYASFLGADELYRKCRTLVAEEPLTGGVFGELASSALTTLKDIGSRVLAKVKEWITSFIGKLKAFFAKVFGPKTHVTGRDFSDCISPTYMAARFWQLMGKIPESMTNAWEDEIKDTVEQLVKMRDKSSEAIDLADETVTRLRSEMEKARQNYGVPSDISWTEGPMPSDGSQAVHELSRVLKQYSPKVAQHIKDLCELSAWKVYDALGSYNPAIMFTDQEALESDVKKALREIDKELALRGETQGSATPAVVVNVPSGSRAGDANTIASNVGGVTVTPLTSASGPGAASPSSGGSVSTTPSYMSDPNTLAAVLANVPAGTVGSIPRAWIAELPSPVQDAYYGTSAEMPSEPIVGDILGRSVVQYPAGRLARARRTWKTSRKGAMMGDPLAGIAPLLIAAAKFFLTTILPMVLMCLPWDKVGNLFKKNSAKADVIKKTYKTRSQRAAAASKSGGALGAFSGSSKWAFKGGGRKIGKILSFMTKNPKLAILGALIGTCFAMGSSYSGRSKVKKGTLELLTNALEELYNAQIISKQEYEDHVSALANISSSEGLTEPEAQEIQTVAMFCAMAAEALVSEIGVAGLKDSYPCIYAFYEAMSRTSDDAKTAIAAGDAAALNELMEDIIAQAAEDESSEHARNGGVDAASLDDNSIPASVRDSLSGMLGTGAAVASLSAAEKQSTDDANASDAQRISSAAEGAAVSGEVAAESATEVDDLLSRLNSQQLTELSSLTDAATSLTDDELDAETVSGGGQVTASVRELLKKWGLPVAAAGILTGLIVAAVRQRRRTSGDDGSSPSLLTSASRWWSEVTRSADPSVGPQTVGDNTTAVAI